MAEVNEGGCACGAARYRVNGKPVVTLVCHCRFCQRRLGTAFATLAYFVHANVELIQGSLTECEHHSDETGRWQRMHFCSKCGTTVTHIAEVRPGMKGVAIGTLDDPDWLKIERHIWVQSKRPWLSMPKDAPAFMRGSAGTGGQMPE